MHPIICQIGPFTVYSYGLTLVLAFFAASFLAAARAKKENLAPEAIINFLFAAFISGIIGARLLYVIQNRDFYFKEPLEIVMLQHGGLSWFGGLIAGTSAGLIFLKRRRLPIYKALDIAAPSAALAQAIGRIGCFLNGCCFGRESALGFYFPGRHIRLIPVQLYSSLLLVIILVILTYLQKRPHRQGEIFYAYLLLYSAKRFLMEFWRGDGQVVFLHLRLFQFFSLILFCLALFALLKIRVKIPRT
ncbi:MAG: prolipoprotein diacylglyceryl transferase [Omnitrophica WOR_2 bacterium RIFCSPLOWO2_12_FULL_51_8]|nr:MAG: prolipoprotein diacylglyceryl transferase [Omnitrophica WOR_2 bacterium RIFCSPLOWO2_12_FULL_51_8]